MGRLTKIRKVSGLVLSLKIWRLSQISGVLDCQTDTHKLMPSTFRTLLALLFLGTFLASCDAADPVISTKDIGNAIWRTNTSMLVFAEQRNYVSTGAFSYKLYEAGSDGGLGRKISDEETGESVPFITVSEDGKTAITILASNLYRLDVATGEKTQLTTNVTKVYAVSPDLKYVLLTHAGLFNPVKTVSLLDISGSPVRSVNEWQIKGLLVSQPGHGQFAFSLHLRHDRRRTQDLSKGANTRSVERLCAGVGSIICQELRGA
jgi:hypothetical protein